MCSKGCSSCSWQKGSLLTVQISVFYVISVIVLFQNVTATYGLQSLLNLRVQGTGLEGDDLGRGIGVVGDRRATLGAEDAVDGVAGGALASPALGGAVDGQLVLGDDRNQGYSG